jgi:hypothetical protein
MRDEFPTQFSFSLFAQKSSPFLSYCAPAGVTRNSGTPADPPGRTLSRSGPYLKSMKTFILLLVFSVALPMFAQERRPEDYVRVLVPAGSVPGAFGAQWTTTVWLRNDSANPVDVFPMSGRNCPVSIGCYRTPRAAPALVAHETALSYLTSSVVTPSIGDPSPTGTFFYVERARIDDVSKELHATDSSRTPEEVTKLPLVPETEFYNSTRSIVRIPLSSANRIALRVFQLDPSMPDGITLRVFQAAPPNSFGPVAALLVERQLRFTAVDTHCTSYEFLGCAGEFIHHPRYILITDLLRQFPELEAALGESAGIRIEIEPQSGLSYWPMVTVTENATNHVTVYTVR